MQELTVGGAPLGLQCVGLPKGAFNIYGKRDSVRIQSGLFLHSSARLSLCLLLISEAGLTKTALQPGMCITESRRQKIKRNGEKDEEGGEIQNNVCLGFYSLLSPQHP